jgi:hypothetical protein
VGQGMQELEPLGEYVFALQITHEVTSVPPLLLEYPGPHEYAVGAAQLALPGAETWPDGQSVHVLAPLPLNVFAPHCGQLDAEPPP